MSLKVAIPKESASGERRVAMEPTTVKKLAGMGVDVIMEKNAGKEAGFSNEDFGEVTLVEDAGKLYADADIIFKVQTAC